MTKAEELITLIRLYESYILKGNDALQKTYNIEVSPLLAKREGIIPASGTLHTNDFTMSFRFHGMGCRFEFGDLVIEFDYSFGDFIYKGFQTSKLFWFIESYDDVNSQLKDKEAFEQAISELESNGSIQKKVEFSRDTYNYLALSYE